MRIKLFSNLCHKEPEARVELAIIGYFPLAKNEEKEINVMSNQKPLCAGVLLGSVLGTASVLLFTTDAGAKFRKSICQVYEEVNKTKLKSPPPVILKDLVTKKNIILNLVLGGVSGGIIGIALGILFAPKAGYELRRYLAAKLSEASAKTQHLANDVASQGESVLKNVGSQVVEITEKAKDFINVLACGANALKNTLEGNVEKVVEKERSKAGAKIKEVISWANIAVRILDSLVTRK